MNITVFTSNQPRHLSLIKDLAKIADKVYAIMEVNTVFPGKKADFFKKSEIMQTYFSHVIASEKKFFGSISFLPENVIPIILKSGDLNDVSYDILQPALNSDKYVVFGASFIKGELIEHLIEQEAVNIHMGVSPYFRGSSCNFWAAFEGEFDKVGATIHLLSRGLDSGNMLFHALPNHEEDPFDLGMRAVKSAHLGLIAYLEDDNRKLLGIKQDRTKEIKYTKNNEFTDEVAQEYLNRISNPGFSYSLNDRDLAGFIEPFIY
jgi:methionyl-tRNA formyltransferase